jgi:acetoin utilization protein AcuB
MNTPVKAKMTKLPHTIGVNISVEKAKAFMAEFGCHHLPVLDGGELVGVISDRDIKLVETIPNGMETPVSELMTDEPVVVHPDAAMKEVVDKMLASKIHSVIVMADGDEPWGIFTSTNALQHLSSILD